MRIFVDTSYYVARMMPRDQWHCTSIRAVKPARGYFSAALTFLERVRRNEGVQIVHTDPALQAEAWDLFGRWGSAGANAVDCISFALMGRLGIRKAFAFDAHFRAAGFDTLGTHSPPREARS